MGKERIDFDLTGRKHFDLKPPGEARRKALRAETTRCARREIATKLRRSFSEWEVDFRFVHIGFSKTQTTVKDPRRWLTSAIK